MKKNVIIGIFTMVALALFAQDENSIYSRMYDSIISNDLEKLSFLIEQTENINFVEYDRHHVFESVFVMSNCEAAELLLIAGLDLSYENKEGLSLKEMILETNNKALINFIEQYKNN